MDLHLSGKTALVTGASTNGCGRAIAVALAREGVAVAVAARRLDSLKKLAGEIKAGGYIEPVALAADPHDPETPKRLAAEARERLGSIDILVNAAGGRREVPLDASREKWDEGMQLNFFSARDLAHALIPGMIRTIRPRKQGASSPGARFRSAVSATRKSLPISCAFSFLRARAT